MIISFECPWCTQLVEVDDPTARQARCDACSTAVDLADAPSIADHSLAEAA